MGVKVLYTSKEVRSAIAEIFRSGKNGRRVAVSAYVGDGADFYLPFPDRVQVICSPTPGATNPNAIRKLISLGARVQFADRLHMKVYWAEAVGVVVTSANLSTNALGVGDLKEAGVLLEPESLDIDKLLAPLDLRSAAPELHVLDLSHREYYKRNPRKHKPPELSFVDWYRSPEREIWKLLVCEEFSNEGISAESRDHARMETGGEPTTWAWSSEGTAAKEDEWVLCAALKREDAENFGWLYVDHVQKVSPDDREYSKLYPYELVQLRPLKTYEPPPFAVNSKFKRAFRNAAEKLGIESETPAPILPGSELLESLYSLLAP
jgi:hypothetical protein